ncbi:MAG: hypothetical protein ACRDGT_11785, partial [Candidatus Limnocylindria bacterium]
LASAGLSAFRRAGAFDRAEFDAAATSVARGSMALFVRTAIADRQRVDRALDRVAEAIRGAGERWRRVQTGALEHYLVALGGWLLVVAGAAVAILVAGAVRP